MLDADYFRRIDILGLKNRLRDIINTYEELGDADLPPTDKFIGFIPKHSKNLFDQNQESRPATSHQDQDGKNPFKADISRSKTLKLNPQDPRARDPSQAAGSLPKASPETQSQSPRSLRKKYRHIIFDLQGKNSPFSSYVLDHTVATEILFNNLTHCENVQLEKFMEKHEFGVFEVLTIAIFLSILNLPEKADKIFDQIQTFFVKRPNPEPTIVLSLMICRIKNLSKLKFSQRLAVLTQQLEDFCQQMHIVNPVLEMDILMIKARLAYCTNQFEACFRFISKSLDVCAGMGEAGHVFLNPFGVAVTQKLFSLKKYSLAYKILLMVINRSKGKPVVGVASFHDDFGLEINSLLIKLCYKLGKFKLAIKHFEAVHWSLTIDQRNQNLIMNENTMVELYCYGVLSYLKLKDVRAANELYTNFYSTVEYMYDDHKMFIGVRHGVKGMIHMVKMADSNRHEKNVRRQADLALRVSKNLELDESENNSLLLFKMMIKLYQSIGRHHEVETITATCIRLIESNYCKYHLQTFDFYVSKIQSLIDRQLFNQAFLGCQEISEYFENFEEFLSEKQLLKLQETKFSLLMDLVKLDELDAYLTSRAQKFAADSPEFRSAAMSEMAAKVEILLQSKQSFAVEEPDGQKDGQLEKRNLSTQLELKQVLFHLKKNDFQQAFAVSMKLLSNHAFFNTTGIQSDIVFTCAKAMVKAVKYNLAGFQEAGPIINELIAIANNSHCTEDKIEGMHLVAMYLFHTGEKLKSLEYLFQVMCYLETRESMDTLSNAWEVLLFKIKTLADMSRFLENSKKNTQELSVYVVDSLKMNLDTYNRLENCSKGFNTPLKLKIILLLGTGFRRVGKLDDAMQMVELCKSQILDMNGGDFFHMHLKLEEELATVLHAKELFREAYQVAVGLLHKVNGLSYRGFNSFLKTKVVRLIHAICEDGGFLEEKEKYEETSPEMSVEDVLEEELE